MKTSPALRLSLLLGLFLVHLTVSVVAVVQSGPTAFLEQTVATWGSLQLLSDLSVAVLLINAWMLADARGRGISAWPYVLLSFPLGTLAPLAYLVKREMEKLGAARRAVATA